MPSGIETQQLGRQSKMYSAFNWTELASILGRAPSLEADAARPEASTFERLLPLGAVAATVSAVPAAVAVVVVVVVVVVIAGAAGTEASSLSAIFEI